MLDRQELFFPSASQLEDPFEGALPFPEVDFFSQRPDDGHERVMRRNLVMISSWHINSDESFAMWKLYSRSIEAVAIQSTVGRLRQSLCPPETLPVLIGKVEYIDYTQDRLEDSHYLSPYFRKARPYSYENEVRAVVDLYRRYSSRGSKERDSAKDPVLSQAFRDQGVYVSAKLDRLMENVYVAPTAGEWFLKLVQSVLKKYQLELRPRQSVLANTPCY